MKSINTYLIFDKNCKQAMEFYNKCLGGELHLVPYSDMPPGSDYPKEAKDLIMHAALCTGQTLLMASDAHPHMPVTQGNNFFVSIKTESIPESEKLFKALSEKGKIDMPIQETFWAVRFGMLTDQFGIKWMINMDKSEGKEKK